MMSCRPAARTRVSPLDTAMNVLITGGAGFIGANLVRYWLREHPSDRVVTLDKLLFGPGNLRACLDNPRHELIVADVSDASAAFAAYEEHGFELAIHTAAQSHVDVSIDDPLATIRSNVLGTATVLEGLRRVGGDGRVHVVSTDEVYGSLGDEDSFSESSPYSPNNPYSASKAGGDHLASAYHRTYGVDVTISHCSNNYGPFQYLDKFIPKMVCNAAAGIALPVYGQGENVRDWLHVEDHCRGIEAICRSGRAGETYCIGGKSEWRNADLVKLLCEKVDARLGRDAGTSARLIEWVADRPGHDYRYALDASKIECELGWRPSVSFDEGLTATVDWYLSNPEWVAEHRGLA